MENKKIIKNQPELDGEFKEKAKKEIEDIIKNLKVRKYADNMEVQLDMDAGFDEETGEILTLRDVLKSGKEVDCKTMDMKIKSQIVSNRLKIQKDFIINIINIGFIHQKRALKEVQKRSKLGIYIIESECKLITRVLEEAKRRIQKGGLQF